MARDLYQEVTDKIVAQLEAGVAPWQKPWATKQKFSGAAYNAVSGKPYRGINQALLFAPEYPTAAWMTFNQAKDIGANVRKGERGSLIVFYKPFAVEDKNAAPDANGDRPSKMIPLLRSYVVFNVAQCDNVPAKYQPQAIDEKPEAERHAEAERVMAQASVILGGDRAFYRTSDDTIRLPQPSQFESQGAYYATALHELTHWTGHAKRLAREYGKRFGDEAYAREELVAEMGAAFLCASVGIAGKLQHAEYIGSWIKVLKGDKRAIVIAAAAAQRATDFCLGTTFENSENGDAIAA